MANLEKSAFLLLMLAVALLRLHGLSSLHKLRGRPAATRARKDARNRILLQQLAILLLACGLTGYGIALWWLQHPHLLRPDWVVAVNHTIVVQVILAILAGLLLANISKFIQTSEARSWGSLLIRGAPLALLFLFGFFPHELRHIVNQITRFETSYFSIEINRQHQKKEVMFTASSRAKPFETNFQAGAIFLKEAVEKTVNDINNLLKFCDRWSSVRCKPFYLSSVTESPAQLDELVIALKSRLVYSSVIEDVSTCLEGYSREFENGVPIQEELSEIAANYAVRKATAIADKTVQQDDRSKTSGNPTMSHEVTESFEISLNNINQHLAAFAIRLDGRSTEGMSDDEVSALVAACKNINPSIIRKHRDVVLESDIVLPYHSMLEAAVLTSSGYPVEGARHLEREYGLFSMKFTGAPVKNASSTEGKSTDLMEVMMRVRMLSMLEQMFENAGKPDDQIRVLEDIATLLGAWLTEVTGVSAATPATWLEACRDDKLTTLDQMRASNRESTFIGRLENGLRDGNSLTEIPELELEETGDVQVRDDFDSYLIDTFRLLTFSNLRRFEELFWRSSQHITLEDTNLAREYVELALSDSSDGLLSGCFGSQDIEIVRFYIFRAFGLLQAAHGTRAPLVDPRIAPDDDDPTRRDALCEAQSTLLAAWRVGQDIRGSGSLIIEEDLRDVVRVGTQLKALGVECRT